MRHPNQLPPNLPNSLQIVSLREPSAPRTCDELGVCQHSMQCTGLCARHTAAPSEAGNYWPDIAPKITEPDERAEPRSTPPVIGEPFNEIAFWLACFASYAGIFAVLGYLWGRHGDKAKAMLTSLWS